MLKSGLLVRLEAAPGKEAEVERLLTAVLAKVQGEAGTRVWVAIRFGAGKFGIFNVFRDATARNAHRAGDVAARLKDAAVGLLSGPPVFEDLDILAAKFPR